MKYAQVGSVATAELNTSCSIIEWIATGLCKMGLVAVKVICWCLIILFSLSSATVRDCHLVAVMYIHSN